MAVWIGVSDSPWGRGFEWDGSTEEQSEVWLIFAGGWIRRNLQALRETWNKTDGCLVPDCEERAMHFPPSRYCHIHLSFVTSKRRR
jgi:hypothetical protein